MGLFDRTTEAFEREVNRLLDDIEDPRENLDYTYERLRDELTRVDEALVDLVTQRKRLEREADRLDDRVTMHNDRAREAVEDGDDTVARDHLEAKRDDMTRLDDVEARIAEMRDAESSLKRRRTELAERVERFRTERAELNARQTAARAEASVADALGEESEDGYADRHVADAADHVEESEARAAAIEELRSEGLFDAGGSGRRRTESAERDRIDAEVESELDTLRNRYRADEQDTDAPEDGADVQDDADDTEESDGTDESDDTDE